MRRQRKQQERIGEFWTAQHHPAELTDQQLCVLVLRLEARIGTTRTVERLQDLAQRVEQGRSLS
jgi:hypothetical protein